MSEKKKQTEIADVKDINVTLKVKTISIPIRGIAPLIVSKFDEKSKQQILEGAPGKAKQAKRVVDTPKEQYEKSLYYLADGKTYGMPAVAFKAAMVRAAQSAYDMQMVRTRTLFHVLADDESGCIKINGTPYMREDMVRIGTLNKVASPRYRACFNDWSALLRITYLDGAISEEQIVALVNAAGFCCGVGEWRPEKCNSGSYGLFQVVND